MAIDLRSDVTSGPIQTNTDDIAPATRSEKATPAAQKNRDTLDERDGKSVGGAAVAGKEAPLAAVANAPLRARLDALASALAGDGEVGFGQAASFSMADFVDHAPPSLPTETTGPIVAAFAESEAGERTLSASEHEAVRGAFQLLRASVTVARQHAELTQAQNGALKTFARAFAEAVASGSRSTNVPVPEEARVAVVQQLKAASGEKSGTQRSPQARSARGLAKAKATAELAKAKLPPAVRKIFEAAMPELVAVVRSTLGALAPPQAHEDLQIPDHEMVRLEQAFARPLGQAKAAMAGKPKSADASAAQATAVLQPVYAMPNSAAAVNTPLPSGDIEAIVEMVMMEAAQEGEKELEDRATAQEKLNQQSESLRKTMSEQKIEEANAKQALQDEYNRRCALPASDPSYINSANVSFEDFSNTQTVVQTPPMQFDADGLPTNSPTYVVSPNTTYYPNTPNAGGIPQSVVDQAAQLNVSPQTLYGLEQRFDGDPMLSGQFATFAQFCLTPAAQGGAGLSYNPSTPQDAAIEAWMSANPPSQGTSPADSSAELKSLMKDFGLSSGDAQAVVDLWNSLPAAYQATYGSDPSALLGPKGANIPAGDDPADAHAKLNAFVQQLQSNLGFSPGPQAIEAEIAKLNPLDEDSDWVKSRAQSANDTDNLEKAIEAGLPAGSGAMTQLDQDLKTYYYDMAVYSWRSANGEGGSPPSLAAIQADISHLPPSLQQAAAGYVKCRLALADQDEQHISWPDGTNSYDFGQPDAIPGNFFADLFNGPPGAKNAIIDPTNGHPQVMDKSRGGARFSMDENLQHVLNTDPFFTETDPGASAVLAAVNNALSELNPPLSAAGAAKTYNLSGKDAKLLLDFYNATSPPPVQSFADWLSGPPPNGLGLTPGNDDPTNAGNVAALTAYFKMELPALQSGGNAQWLADANTFLGETDADHAPPTPTYGMMEKPPSGGTSSQTSKALQSQIDKLNTPVDHTVTQPGTQEVNGKEMTISALDAQLQSLQSRLDSLGDMSQQSQLEIQIAQDRSSKFYEMLSNILKSVNDTQNAIVANIKD